MDIDAHDIRTAFDGEGSLAKSRVRGGCSWALTIANTDLAWLQLIDDYLKGQGYHTRIDAYHRRGRPNYKTGYHIMIWRLTEISRFLEEFPSLMPSRQKRIAEFRQYRLTHRRGMYGINHSAAQEAVAIMRKHSRELL